jgi:ABC-type phosphate transport system permease subunit
MTAKRTRLQQQAHVQDERQSLQDDRQDSQDTRQVNQDSRAQTIDTRLAVMSTDIRYMRQDVNEIKNNVVHGYVTKEEFDPVRRIVYGMVTVILLSFVGAIVALVIKK